ncbi:MAG: hypothetical protein GC152_06700 [Alphaproteobacteria bacterium]|nr:hypothetical protein [Alphaproteobacteria bacterium]
MKPSSEQTLLVLGASRYQGPVIVSAQRSGRRVIAVDGSRDASCASLADDFIHVDTTDANGILNRLSGTRIDGVIAPATDVAMAAQAKIAAARGLWGPPVEAARALSDKNAFRRLQVELSLPTPAFRTLAPNDSTPTEDFADAYVVKPARSSGGKGAGKALTLAGAGRLVDEARRFSSEVLFEALVDGLEGTVEGAYADGRLLASFFTRRTPAEPPNVATVRHAAPAGFTAAAREDAIGQIAAIFVRLNIRRCYFDCDFIVDAATGRVVLLELAPRIGGNSLSRLIDAHWGIDVPALGVDLALHGADPAWPGDAWCASLAGAAAREDKGAHAIEILTVDRSGRLSYDLAGATQLRTQEGVLHLELDYLAGAAVRAFANGRDRVGEALVAAASISELEDAIVRLRTTLKLTVECALP